MGLIVGDPIPLYDQLVDYDDTKFVRAYVTDSDGVAISGSPFSMPAIGVNGLYGTRVALMPNKPWVQAQYIVYDDSGFTTRSETEGGWAQAFFLDQGGSSSSSPATSNILAFVDPDGCSQSPIQDTIVQGTTRVLTIRLAEQAGGNPFTLYEDEVTAIEFRMRNEDGSALSINLDDAGSPIAIVNEGAGQMTVKITDEQTAVLLPQLPSPATIIVTKSSGTTVINLPTQIAVEEAEV